MRPKMICQNPSRTDAGYTLVELLIVVAILALLVVALPLSYAQWRPGIEAKAAVQALAETLRGARVAAITSRQETAVVIDLSARTYAAQPITRPTRFADGVSLSIDEKRCLKGARVAEIRFYADGGASGCKLTIGAGGRSYRITVYWLTGRVAVDEAA
jgi:general secretion pathway protein H